MKKEAIWKISLHRTAYAYCIYMLKSIAAVLKASVLTHGRNPRKMAVVVPNVHVIKCILVEETTWT